MLDIGVYQIELNEKVYIGSSSYGIKKRWSKHLSHLKKGIHDNEHLQRAFNKHGSSTLKFSVLEIVEKPEHVIKTEQKYIDEIKPEYNMCPIAGSCLRRKHSVEARRKMSKALKGRVLSEEHKRKISEATKGNKRNLGRKLSEEHKRKISEAKKGNKIWLGRKHTDESKRKIKEMRKKQICTEETRRKMSETRKGNTYALGHIVPLEARQKIGLATKLRWEKADYQKIQYNKGLKKD